MDLNEALDTLKNAGFVCEDSKYDDYYKTILSYFPDAKNLSIHRNMSIRNSNYIGLYGWECSFNLDGKRHWFSFGRNSFGFLSSFESYIAKYCGLDSFKDYLEMKKQYPEATLEDFKDISRMG